LASQLAEKTKLVEANIHELDIQKILSIENEGIVSSAVHAYRLGFIKGVEKFQQEKLFAGSTGLFN
jgi:adenine/guanine phosphoribosyltransferase-like PRPP-binding protein